MKEIEYRHKKQRDRVDLQVLVLTALIVIVSCYFVFFINHYFFYKTMIEDLRLRAYNIHDYLEERLDNETFYRLNIREDSQDELYIKAKTLLENTKTAAGVRYLYTAKEDSGGNLIYLVDGLPFDSEDFRYIGDAIEPECVADMRRALAGEQVLPQEINKTTWGSIFIAYFPMHQDNEIIGVLGIEFDAKNQYEAYHKLTLLMPAIIILFCMIGALVAVRMFRRISNPSYQDLASTDFLTGLKNRNAFETDLNNLDNFKDKQAVVLFSIDLDRLKAVNDTYGHAAGDEYIRTGAAVIQECLREKDILYRIGGDEFSVILKGGDEAYLDEVIRRAKEKMEEIGKTREYDMGISMGYAFYDGSEDATLFDTLKRADRDMYKDKKKDRE